MSVPTIGDIVYLASCAIQVDVKAVTTSPDTPNQYSADLKVMGDAGDMNLDAVAGPKGPDGQPQLALRSAPSLGYPLIGSPADLPALPNDVEHIGLYWLIDEVDAAGHILAEWCYVWWGSYYRQIMMGSVGPPGPIPDIDIVMLAVDPADPAQVLTSGGTLNPTWQFLVPAPTGPPGSVGSLFGMPDVDVVDQSPPAQLSATPSGSGGSLAANTYYYVVTAVTEAEETFPSNEATATTTGSTSKVTLAWNAAGVNWNVGASNAAQIVTISGSPTGGSFLLAVGGYATAQTVTITGSPSGGNFTLTYDGDTTAQTVVISGGPTGGTFSLIFGGHTASGIAYNASALDVQNALTGLTGVGAGNVLVTGGDGGPYTVWFMNLTPTSILTASSSLTGGSPSIATNALPYNASAATVQAALNALGSVAGNATVTGSNGGPYTVSLANLPAGAITAKAALTGGSTPAIGVAGLVYNAAASAVQTALTALDSVGTGNVAVYGPNGGPYLVEFVDVPPVAMATTSGQLTGGTNPAVTAVPAGYKIYRGTGPGAENKLVGAVSDTTLSYIDTGALSATYSPPEPTLIKYVLAHTGQTAPNGSPLWSPLNFEQFLPRTFSMPETDFFPYVGISQQANIGSFVLPPQPFPWTPLVWGHLSAGGLSFSNNALMIGCQVLLGNATSGQQIGRGLGNTLGEINIMPHYSQPKTPNANIKPNNGIATVPGSPSAVKAFGTGSGGVLAASTTYYYVVTAVTADGETPPSLEATVVTPASATSEVNLTWATPPAVVSSYNVYRGTTPGGENILAGTSTTAAFTDKGHSTTTASPPPPTILYVNLYNDGQLGFYSFAPSPTPSPFQNLLDDLVQALGTPVATIENVIGLLGNWVSSIPNQIQTQLNAVAHLIGTSPIGQAIDTGITAVAQYLSQFQPLVNQLATALGIPVIEDAINQVITELESFGSTITNEIQAALDSVAQQFGLPGVSHTIESVGAQLSTLQPALQNLADQLLQNTIPNVITVIGGFVGSVTGPIQSALNAVANALSFSNLVNYTTSEVSGFLGAFQTNIDAVATALGISAINNTLTDLIGFLVPWATAELGGLAETAISGLLDFLGATGLEATVLNLVGFLLALIGDIFSGYTTAAQMFVLAVPMLEGTTTL